jgi:hypothetical protein
MKCYAEHEPTLYRTNHHVSQDTLKENSELKAVVEGKQWN